MQGNSPPPFGHYGSPPFQSDQYPYSISPNPSNGISPPRNNYHINPAESKIVYKSQNPHKNQVTQHDQGNSQLLSQYPQGHFKSLPSQAIQPSSQLIYQQRPQGPDNRPHSSSPINQNTNRQLLQGQASHSFYHGGINQLGAQPQYSYFNHSTEISNLRQPQTLGQYFGHTQNLPLSVPRQTVNAGVTFNYGQVSNNLQQNFPLPQNNVINSTYAVSGPIYRGSSPPYPSSGVNGTQSQSQWINLQSFQKLPQYQNFPEGHSKEHQQGQKIQTAHYFPANYKQGVQETNPQQRQEIVETIQHRQQLVANQKQVTTQLSGPTNIEGNLNRQQLQIKGKRQNGDAEQEQAEQGREEEETGRSSRIWEQRFIMIYQKFEWFYERYDFISREFASLSQDFENVNSEDEWLELKEKHDLLLEKIQEIQEELAATIQENQELAQQYQLENRHSKDSDEGERVWQHRYHQLLEQYQSLSQNYADLQSQGPANTSQSQHSSKPTAEEILEMQSKFQELEQQYNVVCEEYQKIRVEYERTYEENNQLASGLEQSRNMANQLQAYVEELQAENDHLKKQERQSNTQQNLGNSVPVQEVQRMQEEFNEEVQRYQQEIQRYQEELQRYQEELQKYQMGIEEYQEQIQSKHQELEKLSEIVLERQNKIKQLEASGSMKSQQSPPHPQFNDTMQIQRLEGQLSKAEKREKQLAQQLQKHQIQEQGLQENLRQYQSQNISLRKEMERLRHEFDGQLFQIRNTENKTVLQEQELVRTRNSNSEYQLRASELQQHVVQLQRRLQELQQHQMEQQNRRGEQMRLTAEKQLEYKRQLAEKEIELDRISAQKDVKIQILSSEVERLSQEVQQVKKEKLFLKEQVMLESKQNQEQVQRLNQDNLTRLEMQVTERELQIVRLKEQLGNYQRELGSREAELKQIKILISQLRKTSNQQHNTSRSQLALLREEIRDKQEALERKNEQLVRLRREKEYKAKQITQLENDLHQLEGENSQKRTEIASLKRQIAEYQGLAMEHETLKHSNNRKNSQIQQLRQQLVDWERFPLENEALRKEADRYSQEVKEKFHEVERLKQQIFQLEKKLSLKTSPLGLNVQTQSLSHSRHFGFRKDQGEVWELKEQLRRKENELARVSQVLQESQLSLENRTLQLESIRTQHAALGRTKQNQIAGLNQSLLSLESKLRDAETKKNALTTELSELRKTFETQLVADSERHKNYYEKVLARYEQDYKNLREKLRTAEEDHNKQESEAQKHRSIVKNFELEVKQLQRKLSHKEKQLLEKDQLFGSIRAKQNHQQNSTKALYEKIQGLEMTLKTKEQQLRLTQEKNNFLEQKIRKNKRDFQTFRNKLITSQQYENNNSVVEYLSKRVAEYESKMINQSEHDFGFQVKDSQANHVFENQIVYQLKREIDMLRRQLEGRGLQHDRTILNQLEQENLKRSKTLLKNSGFSSKVGAFSSQYLARDNAEDLSFYKEKNKKLQEMVEKHEQANKNLLTRIQGLIKSSPQNLGSEGYQQKINDLERLVSTLEKKIEVLTEENRNVSRGMSKRQSRVEGHYEERVRELENKNSQLFEELQTLKDTKSQLQITLSELQMQKSIQTEEINRLNLFVKELTTNQQTRKAEDLEAWKEKCRVYEAQITKLTNKTRVLESQIQRLNEVLNSSKVQSQEINTLRNKISELAQSLSKAEAALHEEQTKTNSLGSQIVKAQQKTRLQESEIVRLSQLNQLYSKKQQAQLAQSQVLKQSTSSTQMQLNSLQSQLSSLASLRDSHQKKIQLLTSQIQKQSEAIQGLRYSLEMIRSGIVEEEALVKEIRGTPDRLDNCLQGMIENVNRNFRFLTEAAQKLSLASQITKEYEGSQVDQYPSHFS